MNLNEKELEFFRQHYRAMSDIDVRIMAHSAHGLKPEAAIALKEEIGRRQFQSAEAMQKQVDMQGEEELFTGDVNAVINAIRRLPCPQCGITKMKLNLCFVKTSKVIVPLPGLIAVTGHGWCTRIACPECLFSLVEKGESEDNTTRLIRFPFGTISGLISLASNSVTRTSRREKFLVEMEEPSTSMQIYIRKNYAVFEPVYTRDSELFSLIKRINEKA